MKTRLNKKSYLLLAILTIFIFGSFMAFGKATTDDFTFNLDEFKETIQGSLDDCWKKLAQNRKNTICNKLTKLQQLIGEENFDEAYDKLLHDIKPKLTGLKTDEQEQTWGNGAFKQAWVTCESLREEYRIECNLILAEINPQSVYDDDKTPPIITIDYDGEASVDNPGVWNVLIEDGQSGIDSVIISVHGIIIFQEQLGGISSKSYNNIAVPATEGLHRIKVVAIDSHQNEIEAIESVDVGPGEEPPTPPIIIG